MGTARMEPFQLALTALQERLRDGRFGPGARIAAGELAEELQLSATPVREALSRLVGEGLIEDRRGQGYFARSLSALDVADLYRISLAQLSIALAGRRRPISRGEPQGSPPATVGRPDPVETVERMFAAWVSEAGGRTLAAAHHTLRIQLGPVRRVEPLAFPDLAEEAAELAVLAVADRPDARMVRLRRFHARRVAAADRLYSLVERAARIEGV